MPKHATLADIAKKSKLSVSTVSLALRHKSGIPEATRARVLVAAESLGYVPKNRLPPLGTGRALPKLSDIGLILRADPYLDPRTNPFYSHVISGIEEECRHLDLNLMMATLPVDADDAPLDVPRLLVENDVDGFLMLGTFVGDPLHRLLSQKHLPVVLVDAYALSRKYDAVVSDNQLGAYLAVSYLIQCGHRHIALLGAHEAAYPAVQQRRAAYERALAEHGLACYFADTTFDHAEIARTTTLLLQQNPQLTAFFAINDEIALTAMNVAQQSGLSVPDDLSIIGFDDIDLTASVVPPLTTVHIDKVGMGRLAVQVLADHVQFPESDPLTMVIQPHLIHRASVAARVKSD